MGVRFSDEEREWRIASPLDTDDPILCDILEDVLIAMVGDFVEVCSRRNLKIKIRCCC